MSAADRALLHVAAMSSGGPVDRSLRVTLNFHPDRLCRGLLVLDAMGRDGQYRSQFETGTSNGGLTAFRGGARWEWESRIFGSAYDDAAPAERPKYGSTELPPAGRRRAAALRVRASAPAAGDAGAHIVLLSRQLPRAGQLRGRVGYGADPARRR
jgi:hypothetical protein